MFASNSEYLDDAANAYIEQIKDQDTLTKTKKHSELCFQNGRHN